MKHDHPPQPQTLIGLVECGLAAWKSSFHHAGDAAANIGDSSTFINICFNFHIGG